MVNKIKGFTLIEMMIVVTIIGILAAIAYPSYQEYVRRTKRVDAQGQMMNIANGLQKYKIVNFSFEKADGSFVTLADVGASGQIPLSGAALYNLRLSNQAAGTWILTATPVGGQVGDGHIVLNHRGEKCWVRGSDKNNGTACIPSATTNWDGR